MRNHAAREKGGHPAARPVEKLVGYQELKRRALGLLISSEWLVGEAKERRLSVSGSTLTAEARSAEAQLRHLLASQEAPITKAVVAAYYRQHITRYERPEQRDIGIVERIATKAAAQRALERVARAKDMTRVAIPESFVKTNLAEVVPRKRAIIKAIFAGKPHTLIGPLPLNEKWCFFEVTSVVPRDVQSLAQLQAAIARRLAAEQQQRTLTDFIAAWRKKWTARTRCSRGYVVQKCSQYRGVEAAEDATAFD